MGSMMTGMGLSVLVWVLIGLVVLAVLVLAGVWVARGPRTGDTGRGDRGPRQDAPREVEILRRRYASGEIDDEEYQRRLDGLRTR